MIDVEAELSFATRLIAWQRQAGRHDLPWQNTRDAYRIWLSEIMLQQTQVSTVMPYYERFLARFPTVNALADAPQHDVLALWAGLGYYARARNLHRCAQVVAETYGGVFPVDPALLAELPGIGRSTAAAISAFAYGTRAAILDGNVKRVLCRHAGIEGYPGSAPIERRLWELAETRLPAAEMTAYTQGLMDLGATLCTRGQPLCLHCPVSEDCIARQTGQQSELPTPKPRKSLPEKESAFLFLVAEDSLFLERRPQQGVWGGLLVPLEMPVSALPAWCQTHALSEQALSPLPTLRHTFTHFHLTLRPYWLACPSNHPTYRVLSLESVPQDQVLNAGLPTPIRKILAEALPFRSK